MIRTNFQVASIGLTFVAAFFLAKGSLGLSVRSIVGLATPRWDYHPELVQNLAQQRADSWAGFLFLLAAFLFQMLQAMLPAIWDDAPHTGAYVGTVLVVVVATFITSYVTKAVARRTASRVMAIMKQDAGADTHPPEDP